MTDKHPNLEVATRIYTGKEDPDTFKMSTLIELLLNRKHAVFLGGGQDVFGKFCGLILFVLIT